MLMLKRTWGLEMSWGLVDESEQEDQSSPAQQKTSLESAGGHAREQE